MGISHESPGDQHLLLLAPKKIGKEFAGNRGEPGLCDRGIDGHKILFFRVGKEAGRPIGPHCNDFAHRNRELLLAQGGQLGNVPDAGTAG